MKAETLREIVEKYTGQKVKVTYITTTLTYQIEGILYGDKEDCSRITLKIHEPEKVKLKEYTFISSGLRDLHKIKILKIETADGETWTSETFETWKCIRCRYKTSKQPEPWARCPKCGGFLERKIRQ